MTKRQEFVQFVDALIAQYHGNVPIPENVKIYLDALRENGEQEEKPEFTDNGKMILQYLQTIPEGMYKARDIAEGLFTSSKCVSGAMRKLVTDGFVEKVGQDPVMYALTDAGRKINIEE